MIFGLLLKIIILKIMNGRKNIILEQKVHLMNHKKFLYYYLIFKKKIIPIKISFCQSSDTIEIKTLLKKDEFIKSSLQFQQTNLTFGIEVRFVLRIIAHMN